MIHHRIETDLNREKAERREQEREKNVKRNEKRRTWRTTEDEDERKGRLKEAKNGTRGDRYQ